MITAELDTSTIEITNSIDNVALDNANIIAGYDNSYNVDTEDLSDLDITVAKKEYTIVGDGIFIPSMYEDAPPWLKEFIDTTIDVAVTNMDQSLIDRMHSILTALDYVPKNQYTEQINQIVSEDGIINSRIATLNSNLTDAISSTNATVAEINLTYASKDEAAAIAINALTASISSDGEIGSALIQLQEAYADLESTTAQSISMLESVMEGEIKGNATAMEEIRTYVGISESGGSTGTGLLADVSILQKQNDGVIETVTGTYDVMLGVENPNNNTSNDELDVTKEPYKSWRNADAIAGGIENRAMHVGDVYIKYSTAEHGYKTYERAYKFIRTSVDNTSPYSTDSEGFTWALIVDTDAQNAYVAALNALDLADNKRRVFTVTPSGPYDEGDLWVRVMNGSNQVWKCQVTREQLDYYNEADWSIASTDDTATVALQTGLADGTVTVKLTNAYVGTTPFLTYLTNEIDSKVGVYSGETAPVNGQPSGVSTNDIYLWFTTASKVLANGTTQTYDITRTYKYSGSVWNEITTDSNITALADLADGKRTVFSGDTVPVGAVARDIWIPSAANGSYFQGEIYQYNGTSWIVATKYSADLEAVRNNLQSQVDGKVDTYYQGTVPTGMTALNNGDYWYCTADVSTYKKGKVYKYVHATTSWVETADVSRYAFDTADGKAAIFTSTNAPTTGYKVNDMLIVIGSFNNGTTTFSDGVVLSSNANRVSGFTASDWVKKINDTEALDAFVSVTYTPTVTNLQNQVDGKVESWYTLSTSDPKSAWTDNPTRDKHDGDMWYQTDTKLSYYYSSSTNSWNLIDDAKAIQALTNAATAQATADGVVVSFYAIKQDTAPATTSLWLNKTGTKVLKKYTTSWVNVAVKVGDTLTAYDPVTKDTSVYVYNSTGWITNTENGIVAGSEAITTLTANLATTNTTVGGHTTQLNTVDTRIANGVASVETKWAYNSIVNINGVYRKSGFGLTANNFSGGGTQANPYTSEFWIDATKLRFTNSANTGRTAPFTIDDTGATPQIKFNGVVEFSNVAGTTALHNSINTAQTTANTANNNAIARTLPSEVAAAVNNNVTTINGSKITTGSITAAQIQANSISADRLTSTNGHSTVWTGGGLVSSNFNGNVNGYIGNPSAGFRLSSNAAGTKTDPNIYGAYIKGGILEGSNLWLSTPAGYAKVQHLDMLYHDFGLNPGPFTYTIYSSHIELVSPTYGSGYLPNRVFSLGSSIISIITTGAINSTSVGVNLSLQYSADDGAWTKLDKFSGNLPGVNVIYYGLCPDFSSTLRIRLSITYINIIAFAYNSTASAALTLINQN